VHRFSLTVIRFGRQTCATIAFTTHLPLLRQFRAAPNLLTLLRLFIIPFLVIEVLDGRYKTAFALFMLAGISDAFDGLLARRLHQHTKLGQYMDPIADKLLLSTLFLVLTHTGLVPRYVTVLVFSRDLGILLIATLLFATGSLRSFQPSLLGKCNTLVQIVALVVALSQPVFLDARFAGLREVLLRCVAVLAPVSAAEYAWIVIRRMNTPGGPNPVPPPGPLSPRAPYR
jgi:cardiolipin synthase